MTGARIFVGLVFVGLGASFLASTWLVIHEFKDDWRTLVLAHSHLFVFFPVLGILALFAFYLPSVILTNFYWNHVRYGRVRFMVGAIVVAALTWWATSYLDNPPRALWEVTPQAFAADKGGPVRCGEATCQRASMREALAGLREAAEKRGGLSKFARNCKPDEYLEEPLEMREKRYCFPAKAMLDGPACCAVQKSFSREVDRLQADPAQRSLSSTYDRIFMPLKVFFVLVVIVIALLLALWRDEVDKEYTDKTVAAMERGLIIGAFAMLLWPAMDYGYQTTANILFGREGAGPQLRLSLVLAPWALLLLFYFLRRLGRQGEMIGQISGVVAAAVAVLRYEELNDWAARLVGVGAAPWMLALIAGLAVAGLVGLIWPWRVSPINADVAEK
jgi:hypothetical protein